MPKTIDGVILSDFVEILLGNARWCYCSRYIADKLTVADKEQQYVFVELPNELNLLDRPKVWNAKDWRDSDERLQKRRKLSELENNVHTLFTECHLRAMNYLANLTGLPADDMTDAAIRIVKKRQAEGMLSVKIPKGLIADLKAADNELAAYQKQIGIKYG